MWMLEFNETLLVVYRLRVHNGLADYLSRNQPDPTEWCLSPHSSRICFRLWGTHLFQQDPSPIGSRHGCVQPDVVRTVRVCLSSDQSDSENPPEDQRSGCGGSHCGGGQLGCATHLQMAVNTPLLFQFYRL